MVWFSKHSIKNGYKNLRICVVLLIRQRWSQWACMVITLYPNGRKSNKCHKQYFSTIPTCSWFVSNLLHINFLWSLQIFFIYLYFISQWFGSHKIAVVGLPKRSIKNGCKNLRICVEAKVKTSMDMHSDNIIA